MFDATTFTQDMLSNPTKLMTTVIDAMEKADATGQTLIQDPNNGFVMQLAAMLSVQSKLSEKIDSALSFVYARRARNAEQLYPHLSEFDYVKLMASPATLPFFFSLDADWIRSVGVYYDDNYDRLEIPATSYITLGGIVYSMYYPIEILINRNTRAITAFYDGSYKNSLHTLASNMLLNVQEYSKDGINYFQIKFNMYQFERTQQIYTVGTEEGFTQTLNIDDQFYAVKISTQNRDGTWSELAYSLSQLYYDSQKPTAILNLLTDVSQLKIKIPQIYFDNNQISKNIKVELYTTKGKINYSLSRADVISPQANFDTSSSDYAAPFDRIPVAHLFPGSIEVVGGSDAMSYKDVRDAIVNQRLSDRVAVTTPEILEAGKRAGFNLTRVKDDLTERIYFAANILTDSKDMIIPTFTGNILIENDALVGDPSTIVNHSDGYYTVLPTTTFKLSSVGNTCVPMSDSEVRDMAQMTKEELVNALNTGRYVRQPFHITLLTHPKSPRALIYNLLSPEMTSLAFIAENPHSAPQMSATSCQINHLYHGTGGYQITLGVTRSSNISLDDIANFAVMLSCRTKGGEYIYIPLQYIGTNDDGVDVWQVLLRTDYHLGNDDYLTVEMYNNEGILSAVEIALEQTFSLVTGFATSYDPSIPTEPSLTDYLPDGLKSSITAMARQEIRLSFGRNLSDQIYCGVNTSWGNDVYKTADQLVYYSTPVPIFQNDPITGTINTRISDDGKAETVLIYPQDAIPADTKDFTTTLTGDVIPGLGSNTVIAVSDTKGILVGMLIRGLNIPVKSVVTAVNEHSITISTKVTTAIPKATALTLTNPNPVLITTVSQSSPGKQLDVVSTANLLVGQSVFGFDIPRGATISSIDSETRFSLSIATTKACAKDTVLTIINVAAPGVVKTYPGDILTDASGKAIIVKSAQNRYAIPAILFDGRLFASDDATDQQVIDTIADRLNSFANQISTIDEGLIEDSDVYYKPARSMGMADFGIGAGQTLNMSLALGFSVKVYVDISVYNTQTLLSSMEATIVETINQEIQKPTISVSAIGDLIGDQLGTNAAAVEMGPISGIDDLRLVSLVQANVTPSIESKLFIETDGHIKRKPNIIVTFLPKPDTSVAVAEKMSL